MPTNLQFYQSQTTYNYWIGMKITYFSIFTSERRPMSCIDLETVFTILCLYLQFSGTATRPQRDLPYIKIALLYMQGKLRKEAVTVFKKTHSMNHVMVFFCKSILFFKLARIWKKSLFFWYFSPYSLCFLFICNHIHELHLMNLTTIVWSWSLFRKHHHECKNHRGE